MVEMLPKNIYNKFEGTDVVIIVFNGSQFSVSVAYMAFEVNKLSCTRLA